MNEKQWKKFIQKEVDKELEEIDGILEEMNNDPKTKDIVAPEEMHEKLIAQIKAGKEQEERLSDEEKELIRLGKVYKKRRSWNKVMVIAVAAVVMLTVGMTALGGPTKIIQKVQGILQSRERINTDTEDNRVDEVEIANEVEAYQKIEDKFGFYPVRMDYLPEGVEFEQSVLTESTQNVYLNYAGENQEALIYLICLNYRTGSIGQDVEDTLLEEYSKENDGVIISVKKYQVEDNQTERYVINYEYQNVYYFIQIFNIKEGEVEKIIENLYFG